MTENNWFTKAACLGQDTELFYPIPGTKGAVKQAEEVKAFCRICDVKNECLEYAIKNEEVFGIWGGTTPKERSKIMAKRTVIAKDISIKVVKNNDNNKV
jgi:WhiB family redox-sensing transcriptional regulator